MNGVYLLPLLLVGLIVPVYAQTEQGLNYDKEVLQTFPDGSQKIKWTSLNYARILDDSNNYQDFIYSDLPTVHRVETMVASIEVNKSSCVFNFYNSGFIDGKTPLFYDSIIPFNSVVDLYSWNEVSQITNTSCETYWTGSELVAKKYVSGVGYMEYKYIWNDGKWKTQLEATNLTSLTDRVFGFDQTIDINSDSIKFGGQIRNLDNFDGQTFNRIFLENNEAKILKLLNDFNFDFDLGFEYLDSISVFDTGENSSKLVFHYMRNNEIILPNETLVIDPTFSGAGESWSSSLRELNNNNVCDDTGGTYDDVGGNPANYISVYDIGSTFGDCIRSAIEWDVTSIPNDATISDVDFVVDLSGASDQDTPNPIDVYSITSQQPSTRTIAQNYDECDNDTELVDSTTFFDSSSTNQRLDLTATADSDLQSHILASNDWYAICMRHNSETQTGSYQVSYVVDGGTPDFTLEVVYNTIPTPDAVDDLASTDITTTTVDLSWTQPNLQTGNLSGYQINYSTPWSNDPSTIITNNTETSDVTTQVSGLSELTPYSFRIGVWTEGFNGTGNILNITTSEDFALANFTPGFFDVNATNDDIIQMFFERQDINSTSLFLNVTYPNTYTLACDFSYEFANINQTYKSLSTTAVSANAVESSFQFNNVNNEIIDVYCWDESNLNNDGSYLITQTTFPLLEQISNFRNGTYGTEGSFGALDLITMAVIIISMIGFNRVNESVGAIFNIILLGALAYFEIIELPTIIFGAIAVVLMLVITSTRKK